MCFSKLVLLHSVDISTFFPPVKKYLDDELMLIALGERILCIEIFKFSELFISRVRFESIIKFLLLNIAGLPSGVIVSFKSSIELSKDKCITDGSRSNLMLLACLNGGDIAKF